MNFKFEKHEGEVCLFKREFSGIGDWKNYENIDQLFHLIKPNCSINAELFPTNTPKNTDPDILDRIEQNIKYCSTRIANLGFGDLIQELYDTLEDLKNPQTYEFNWDISKYTKITNEEYYESSSDGSFDNPHELRNNLQLKLNK